MKKIGKGSITSKYETVIYPSIKQKGFGSSVERSMDLSRTQQALSFTGLINTFEKDEVPGPGFYNHSSS